MPFSRGPQRRHINAMHAKGKKECASKQIYAQFIIIIYIIAIKIEIQDHARTYTYTRGYTRRKCACAISYIYIRMFNFE